MWPVLTQNLHFTLRDSFTRKYHCVHILGDTTFEPTSVDHQVQWPWTETENVGTLYTITDGESASECHKTNHGTRRRPG